MRIGFSVLGLLPDTIGGVETYIRGLLNGLGRIDSENEYVVFTNRDNHESFDGLGRNFRRILYDFSGKWDVRSLAMTRLVGEQLYLPYKAARESLDILHLPLDTIPLLSRCRTVMTLHDLNFDAVPEATTAARRMLATGLVKASARRADAIVTVSNFSREEIISKLGIAPDRVSVTYNAVDHHPLTPRHDWAELAGRLGVTKPFVIAFSSLNPHKNIATLLRAFSMLKSRERWQLMVVGHLPTCGKSLVRMAAELGIADSVAFTGYLSRRDLTLALHKARALVFPSLYEGFGIPLLEAMSVGVPTACSNVAALPEVAGEAALFFNPLSPENMAATVERLLTDELARERLIAAGHDNVRRFSWEQTARRTLEVYRRVAGGAGYRRGTNAEAA